MNASRISVASSPASTACMARPRSEVDPPMLNAGLDCKARWSDCPPDVLARCFTSQQDFNGNSAATCVCRSWRDTFRGCAEQISIDQNRLQEGPLGSTYLQQFSGLHTVESEQKHRGSWPRVEDCSPQQGRKWPLDPWSCSNELDRWISNSCIS